MAHTQKSGWNKDLTMRLSWPPFFSLCSAYSVFLSVNMCQLVQFSALLPVCFFFFRQSAFWHLTLKALHVSLTALLAQCCGNTWLLPAYTNITGHHCSIMVCARTSSAHNKKVRSDTIWTTLKPGQVCWSSIGLCARSPWQLRRKAPLKGRT